MKDFTHLHLHSSYSILDGLNKIPDLAKRTKELGMTSVALTDHGWMGGTIEFYKACKKEGVKPILGVEAYITDDEDSVPKENRHRDNHHLVMVAMNQTGYKNLLFMSSNASVNNFYYKPRISKTVLTAHSEGIIATSACLGNEVNHKACWENSCYTDPEGSAEKAATFYKTIFGDRYYLEIQDNDDKAGQQSAYNQFVIGLGKKLDIPIVITSDAHYLRKEDKGAHDLVMAMQIKKTIAEYLSPDNEFQYGPWFYVRSPEEMWEAANKHGCPDAFHNANRIGQMCNVEIELGKYKPPEFDISTVEDRDEFEAWLLTRHKEDEAEHQTNKKEMK